MRKLKIKDTSYINLHKKSKLDKNQVEPFVTFITRIELIRWNEKVIEEAR